MKMIEFRPRQPLNDDDFKTIRRNVMKNIAARRERQFFPVALRFALAAAAVVAIVIALVPHRPAPVAITKPAALIATAPMLTVVAPVAVEQPVRHMTHRPRHHRTPHIELAHQNIRVEFRTSDPDIRIIWIASQTPNTTGGKS